jgi:hypothetical protein
MRPSAGRCGCAAIIKAASDNSARVKSRIDPPTGGRSFHDRREGADDLPGFRVEHAGEIPTSVATCIIGRRPLSKKGQPTLV